jgi:hypothetical protein
MELNIINLIYLFFRFAPFIIVSYFTLESIFNQDLKGVIYLIGLIIASVCTILVGGIIGTSDVSLQANTKCTNLTIGNNQPISKLPLSQTVFGYTLSYLSYFIGVNNLATQNIPTFVIFPLIILADMMWNTSNGCSSNPKLLAALIIGGLVGVLWAIIIDSTGMVNLTYFSGVSNKAVCSQPSRSMYRCRVVNQPTASP